jgi:acyl-CoA thioesterase FadM
MPTYAVTLAHRPDRDGRRVTGRHVPFYLALEVMAECWAAVLAGPGKGLLLAGDVGVVNVECDFRHEVFVGDAEVVVELVRLGVSSVTFSMRLHQFDRVAASGCTVVARTDTTRTRSLPLTAPQREALEPLVTTPADV